MNRITVKEFIEKYKIIHPLAVGFLSHLRVEKDTEIDESVLAEKYFEFSGRKIVVTETPIETGLRPVHTDNADKPQNTQEQITIETGKDARSMERKK